MCRGSNASSTPEPLHECPFVGATYTQVGDGQARYELNISTSSTRADKLFLAVTFDTPVTNIMVSASSRIIP